MFISDERQRKRRLRYLLRRFLFRFMQDLAVLPSATSVANKVLNSSVGVLRARTRIITDDVIDFLIRFFYRRAVFRFHNVAACDMVFDNAIHLKAYALVFVI